MQKITNAELIDLANGVTHPMKLSKFSTAGTVGCALLSKKGKVFVGICLDLSSGLGTCAEYTAIANMVATGESEIKKIVAVSFKGEILPPCGRCRELMYEVNSKNVNAKILLSKNKSVTLKKLLPHNWQVKFKSLF
jgi:cytidine deaminase